VRRLASHVPGLKARVVAGREVRLVNVAKRGVLFETEERLLPNTSIRIRFQAADRTAVIAGQVVRSSVSRLSARTLSYKTAISLDEDLSVCDAEFWQEEFAPHAGQGSRVGKYLGTVRAFVSFSNA
jgi:hypothetical protein